jgi:proline dehydrogenase
MKSKTLADLLRSYIVFTICQNKYLVKHSEALIRWSYLFLGHYITNLVLKNSFFGHFCAGEDAILIKPTVDKLHQSGIGAILDYAAEDDIEEESKPAPDDTISNRKAFVECRVYDYKNEELCDLHVKTFEKCIEAVHDVSPTGFAALKLTALGNPRLLETISIALIELRRLFQKFDTNASGIVTREEFMLAYEKYFSGGDVDSLFQSLDVNKDGCIDYVEWSEGLLLEDLHKLTNHCRETGPLKKAVLDENELVLLGNMYNRIDGLSALAQKLNVRLMIDAEHSYYQPAIDYITKKLTKKYNINYPVIFNTCQLYLKDSKQRLLTDLDRAKRGQYHFAAKLVRGAYMVHERKRAVELDLDDPIHATIEDTHINYNSCVKEMIQRIAQGESVEIMIASHNQKSVEHAIECMNAHKLSQDSGIYFGTLLGMSDNLSYTLGLSGYKAYKYVPYGKIEEVMPYLIRRAQENSDALSGAVKELTMIQQEIRRRIFSK